MVKGETEGKTHGKEERTVGFESGPAAAAKGIIWSSLAAVCG